MQDEADSNLEMSAVQDGFALPNSACCVHPVQTETLYYDDLSTGLMNEFTGK